MQPFKTCAPHTLHMSQKRQKITQIRRRAKIRFSSDLERIIGANPTQCLSRHIDLKDRKLTDFLKSNKGK